MSNAIVIIDEAHNVEEFSREGASCSLKLDDLHACEEQLNKISMLRFSYLLSYLKTSRIFGIYSSLLCIIFNVYLCTGRIGLKPDSCRELLKFVHLLKAAVLSIGEQIKFSEKDFEEASRVFTNKNDMLALLRQVSITSIEEIIVLQVEYTRIYSFTI